MTLVSFQRRWERGCRHPCAPGPLVRYWMRMWTWTKAAEIEMVMGRMTDTRRTRSLLHLLLRCQYRHHHHRRRPHHQRFPQTVQRRLHRCPPLRPGRPPSASDMVSSPAHAPASATILLPVHSGHQSPRSDHQPTTSGGGDTTGCFFFTRSLRARQPPRGGIPPRRQARFDRHPRPGPSRTSHRHRTSDTSNGWRAKLHPT